MAKFLTRIFGFVLKWLSLKVSFDFAYFLLKFRFYHIHHSYIQWNGWINYQPVHSLQPVAVIACYVFGKLDLRTVIQISNYAMNWYNMIIISAVWKQLGNHRNYIQPIGMAFCLNGTKRKATKTDMLVQRISWKGQNKTDWMQPHPTCFFCTFL